MQMRHIPNITRMVLPNPSSGRDRKSVVIPFSAWKGKASFIPPARVIMGLTRIKVGE